MTDRSIAMPMTANNRRDVRQVTVLIIGKVSDPRGEYACVVQNISRSGLKARFPYAPKVGERLTFTLRGVPDMGATVRWVEGNQGGVEFDRPLDLSAILDLYGSARMPRAPRFGCQRAASLILDGKDYGIELLDVSLGGAKLHYHADTPTMRGRVGALVLPTIDERRIGTVRWDDGARVGFQFATPLTLELLAKVLSRSDSSEADIAAGARPAP